MKKIDNSENSNRQQNSEIRTNDIINDLDINDDKDIETFLMKLFGSVKQINTNLINRRLKEILSEYSFDDLKLDDKSKNKILS